MKIHFINFRKGIPFWFFIYQFENSFILNVCTFLRKLKQVLCLFLISSFQFRVLVKRRNDENLNHPRKTGTETGTKTWIMVVCYGCDQLFFSIFLLVEIPKRTWEVAWNCAWVFRAFRINFLISCSDVIIGTPFKTIPFTGQNKICLILK